MRNCVLVNSMSRVTVWFNIMFLSRQWLSKSVLSLTEYRCCLWRNRFWFLEICLLLRIAAAVRLMQLLNVFLLFCVVLLHSNFAWFCTAIARKGKPKYLIQMLQWRKIQCCMLPFPKQKIQDFISNLSWTIAENRWQFNKGPWKSQGVSFDFSCSKFVDVVWFNAQS